MSGRDVDNCSAPNVSHAGAGLEGAGLLFLHRVELHAHAKEHAFAVNVHYTVVVSDVNFSDWSVRMWLDLGIASGQQTRSPALLLSKPDNSLQDLPRRH